MIQNCFKRLNIREITDNPEILSQRGSAPYWIFYPSDTYSIHPIVVKKVVDGTTPWLEVTHFDWHVNNLYLARSCYMQASKTPGGIRIVSSTLPFNISTAINTTRALASQLFIVNRNEQI